MTEAPQKSEPRWAELSDDVLESVEAGRKQTIDAVRKFVDQISHVVPEQPRRQTVVDAALDLAEELVTSRIVSQCGAMRGRGVSELPSHSGEQS